MLERGRMRRLWALAAAALVAFGVYDAATHAEHRQDRDRPRLPQPAARPRSSRSSTNPKVKAALRCGPVSVPDHKLRPDVMLLTDRGAGRRDRPQPGPLRGHDARQATTLSREERARRRDLPARPGGRALRDRQLDRRRARPGPRTAPRLPTGWRPRSTTPPTRTAERGEREDRAATRAVAPRLRRRRRAVVALVGAGAAAVGDPQRPAVDLQRRRVRPLRAGGRRRCSPATSSRARCTPPTSATRRPSPTCWPASTSSGTAAGTPPTTCWARRTRREIWLIARVVCAALGTLSVWLLYLAGARLFDRRTGLLAAAVLAVAFLPVFYSKLALNDVPALVGGVPVAVRLAPASCATAAGAPTCSPGSGSAWPRRRSTPAASSRSR